MAEPGQRHTALPEQHTDYVYSIVLDTKALLLTILVLSGPPGLLTVAWLYGRRRRVPGAPT